MNYKFSDLVFGQEVHLSGGTACCGSCGADVQTQTKEILWKYVGHSDDLDLFEAVTLAYCPTCGSRIDGYAERCGDVGGLDISNWVKVPEQVERG